MTESAAEMFRFGTKSLNEIKAMAKEQPFYSVRLRSDYGFVSVYFPSLDLASIYFKLLNRNYKQIYKHNQDGTTELVRKHGRSAFDFFAPIKDIYSVPCMKMCVADNEAYAHFNGAILVFKYRPSDKSWHINEKRVFY